MNLPRSRSDHMGLRIHHMPFYGQEETSWAPPWIRPDNDLRVGFLEWARRYLDPRNLQRKMTYPKTMQL
jgi:hypothetical protein